ncbi:MAG: RNA polymerase sigma factor [Firmicutes bacterium]|nr:RNA polymerase sigma factor [Bacillota bacterium]
MTFGELYEEYASVVYGYLMFKLRESSLAEDVLQETFLAVHQSIHRLPEVVSPKAWILSIAHNKMVDALRKRTAVETVPVETIPDGSYETASNLVFAEAMTQLAETERTIIYGLYAEGLTCSELGQILDIPEGTVKSKAHYARKKLYQWLQEGT